MVLRQRCKQAWTFFIRATDTIWKEGIEKGVLATRVKNLLPPAVPPAQENSPEITQPGEPPSDLPAAQVPSGTPISEIPAESAGDSQNGTPPDSAVPSAALLPATESPDTQAENSLANEKESSAAQAPDQGPEGGTAVAPTPSRVPARPARLARAIAVAGAILGSQDGTRVQFRKKCSKCGFEETSRSSMPIRSGITRVNFYCPKCRKMRQAEIQGIL